MRNNVTINLAVDTDRLARAIIKAGKEVDIATKIGRSFQNLFKNECLDEDTENLWDACGIHSFIGTSEHGMTQIKVDNEGLTSCLRIQAEGTSDPFDAIGKRIVLTLLARASFALADETITIGYYPPTPDAKSGPKAGQTARGDTLDEVLTIIRDLVDNVTYQGDVSVDTTDGIYRGGVQEAYDAISRLKPDRTTSAPLNYKKLAEWALSDQTGASSACIAQQMMGLEHEGDHPMDAGDFRHCEVLLNTVPGIRQRLPEMAQVSAEWKALVEHWQKLRDTSYEDKTHMIRSILDHA